jgi:hypothetical protein
MNNYVESLKEYARLTNPPILKEIIEQTVAYIEELELQNSRLFEAVSDLKDIYEPEWRDEI